jgi:hypothetical protein
MVVCVPLLVSHFGTKAPPISEVFSPEYSHVAISAIAQSMCKGRKSSNSALGKVIVLTSLSPPKSIASNE